MFILTHDWDPLEILARKRTFSFSDSTSTAVCNFKFEPSQKLTKIVTFPVLVFVFWFEFLNLCSPIIALVFSLVLTTDSYLHDIEKPLIIILQTPDFHRIDPDELNGCGYIYSYCIKGSSFFFVLYVFEGSWIQIVSIPIFICIVDIFFSFNCFAPVDQSPYASGEKLRWAFPHLVVDYI